MQNSKKEEETQWKKENLPFFNLSCLPLMYSYLPGYPNISSFFSLFLSCCKQKIWFCYQIMTIGQDRDSVICSGLSTESLESLLHNFTNDQIKQIVWKMPSFQASLKCCQSVGPLRSQVRQERTLSQLKWLTNRSTS